MIPLIALLILCMSSSSSAAINANNARYKQLRQPNKGTDRLTSSSAITRSLQLLNLKQPNRNKNKTPRPDKTKRPTETKHPSPTSSPSIDSLSPSVDSLDELSLDGDTNITTADKDEIFSASSIDNDTHNPNDTIIDDGESLTDVYVVQDSSLEEDFIHGPLSGGNDKPIISSSEDMSKDTVEDVFSSSTKTINVGPFDMKFTMYNKNVAQPNKKQLLRLLQSTNTDEKDFKDTLEQIASDLYSIAARDHLAAIYEATFSDIPSFNVRFEDEETTPMSQGTFYNSKFDVDFYYDESNANGDIPSEDELKQMILLAFTDEKNKEQFYQRFHDLYANDSNVQQIESVGEIGGTGAGALLKKLYNVDVEEVGLEEDEANTVSEATSEANPSSSDSSDSGISTGLFIALTVLSCAIIIVTIVGFTVYWKKYHRSSNENRSGSDEPKYWKPLNNEIAADDLALVESNDLEQQQEYDMNIMSQMQVEGAPAIGSSEYDAANQETTQKVSSPYNSSIQDHNHNQQEQLGSNQDISELHEGSVVSGWSMSEVADHDDTTNVDEYNTDDDGISLSNTSLVGAGELFRTVMRYDTDDEGQKVVPDMGTDKLNTTTETEIVEDYDEDFLGYVVDNDDDSESRGAFIKEILSRSDEEEDGGEENDFL